MSALDLLAWGHYQHGQLADALAMLKSLVHLEPLQPHHHFKIGMIYEVQGNLPLAMASLLRAASLDEAGEVGTMATEAVTNLDQVQIEQVLMRAESDPQFRRLLQHDPECTLLQTGYMLAPSASRCCNLSTSASAACMPPTPACAR